VGRDRGWSYPLAFLDAVVETQGISAEQSTGRYEDHAVNASDAIMNAPLVFFEP
jgi:hypothetical protein